MTAMFQGQPIIGLKGDKGDKGDPGPESKQVYSTEETVVGTWIDGKPIYRKVVQFVTPDTHTVYKYIPLDDAMETPVRMYGFMAQPRWNDYYPLTFVGADQANVGIFLSKKRIAVFVVETPDNPAEAENYYNLNAWVAVEYTKSTDVPSTASMLNVAEAPGSEVIT